MKSVSIVMTLANHQKTAAVGSRQDFADTTFSMNHIGLPGTQLQRIIQFADDF